MAYLNAQERDALLEELKGLDFLHAKRKLFRADKKGRLCFYRNAQHSGQLETRFDLEGLGTRVTLVEKHQRIPDPKGGEFFNSDFELIDIVVEALPSNRL